MNELELTVRLIAGLLLVLTNGFFVAFELRSPAFDSSPEPNLQRQACDGPGG